MTGYRVVQWATGNIGSYALRAVIEHPDLTLAGVYVHTEAKAGLDAGALCGLEPTGVLATNRADEIIALNSDCVLYMPAAADIDELGRLLTSGINVVATTGAVSPADRDRVAAACDAGGTTIYSTGSSPGFISEAVPLVLTSIQRRLDGLTIDEYADLSARDSPRLLFDQMGFGRPPAEFDPQRFGYGKYSFGPSLEHVAVALGVPLDEVTSTGEVAVARHDTHIAAGIVRAGTVGAQRMVVDGRRAGRPLLRFRATWYCATELDPAWEARATGWHIAVDGDAPLDIDLRFPVPPDRMAATFPAYTANRAVNAVRYVCAAPPGIATTTDLPQIIAQLT